MGKQTRRKKQRHNRPQGAVSTDSGVTDSGNDKHKTTSTGGSLLLLQQRIRHADPRTRHAALTALSATLLDPEQLVATRQNQISSRKISTDLLQAVRERIMDDDLECAQAAAGCLANFVTFGTPTDDDQPLVTAGWTVVLLERLQQCRDILASSLSSLSLKWTHKASRKQWLALTAQCLQALCGLLETNPAALDRVLPTLSQTDISKPQNFINIMLGLLSLGQAELDARSKVASDTTTTTREEEEEYVQIITIYSARTLHSALDDNLELLEPWLHSQENTVKEGWELLQSACWNATLPAIAKLHATGCLVTGRQVLTLALPDSPWTNVLHQHVIDTAIPLLHQQVDFRPDIATALLERYMQTIDQWQMEEADDALERDVIRTVQNRKEPARLIARRQKAAKDEKNNNKDIDDKNDVDDDETMEEAAKSALPDKSSNAREAMERARAAWNSSLLPLQLALEISANLTSLRSPEEDGDDNFPMDEDDDMQWGPDQEAQLLAQAQSGERAQVDMSPLDTLLMEKLVSSGLPDRVLSVLNGLCTPLASPANKELPVDVKEDLEALQSKCAACLGNCFSNLSSWQESSTSATWNVLKAASEMAIGTTSLEGICNVMVIALRARPQLRKQMQEDDLDFFLKWSSSSSDNIQRDMVSILGLLCSTEEHPVDVNRKVCAGLLSVLKESKSAMVTSEVLNSLMDIYGNDGHPTVFDSMDVLGHFQRTLPSFKKRIQAERTTADEEELAQWKETALNAGRFISYKKGQL